MVTSIFISCVIFITILFLWKKRWLLYHAWKIPGPFSVPLVFNVVAFSPTKDNFFERLCRNMDIYRPVAKGWAGSHLFISTVRPTDVEKILTLFLSKPPVYKRFNSGIEDSLLTSEVGIWKKHRRMINPSFNLKFLNSFHDVFVKYSSEMVKFLNNTEANEQTDLVSVIWEKTLDSALANLTNVGPHVIKERYDVIRAIVKIEDIFIQRLHKFWLLIDFFWKLSESHKEFQKACHTFGSVVETIISEECRSFESEDINDDITETRRFLPHLIQLKQSKQITHEEILAEMSFMLLASSETTAITINTVLIILGIYPDIQDRVYQELVSILPIMEKDPTLEDINRLDYLERVIKETMRLLPTVPLILRYTEEDIRSDPYVFPAGSNFIIPIVLLHRDPEVWPEPEKFDPDRFLPDEAAKRHRCSYIPFSFGLRNCIGLKYGMMSMKVMIAMILRSFKVRTIGIKSWKDIDCDFSTMLKPKCTGLFFEKRRF